MVPLASLWMPIVLSAVIVFVASSIIHMLLPYHRSDYHQLPHEDKFMSTLRPDNRANEKLYGKKASAREIVRLGKVGIPPSAAELLSVLNTHSPKNRSDPKSLK